MGLLMLDSFDHYATAQLTQKWTQIYVQNGLVAIAPSVGRRGTQALRINRYAGSGTYSSDVLLKTLAPADNKCIVGFAWMTSGAFSVGTEESEWIPTGAGICAIRYSGVVQVWFRPNSDGTISAFRGPSATFLGKTTAALSVGVYYYLEFKVVIHDSAGTVDIRIDGVSALSVTGLDTNNHGTALWNEIGLGPHDGATSAGYHYDDLYVADGSGSRWNDFMGDMRVDALYPEANGTNRDFVPSIGTDDFGVVDETLANSDTDFLETGTVGHKVTMNYPNAPVPGADIFGVQVTCQARKTDAGTAGHSALARVGGVDYPSASKAIPSSYAMVMQHFPENPATSAPWTDTAFNAAEFGALKDS